MSEYDIEPINSRRDTRPFKEKFMVPWYFTTALDKGFLLFLLLMTIYAIIRILFTGFW
jgi:hypothetical protein